jgi:MmpS family membrane protein
MNIRWLLAGVISFVTMACTPISQHSGGYVTYEVNGTNFNALNVTYTMNGGQQQEVGVRVPWSKSFQAAQGFQALVLTAQNAEDGQIICRIYIDNKMVTERRSDGQYAPWLVAQPPSGVTDCA